MSAWLFESTPYNNGIVATIWGDTDSDLPSVTAFDEPLKEMSIFKSIETGTKYILNSQGVWKAQPTTDLSRYITVGEAQIDYEHLSDDIEDVEKGAYMLGRYPTVLGIDDDVYNLVSGKYKIVSTDLPQNVPSNLDGTWLCIADSIDDDFRKRVTLLPCDDTNIGSGMIGYYCVQGTNGFGPWHKFDLGDYYTSTQTDSAISTALSTYTTDTLNKAVAYDRGQQILATTDEHFNVFGITTRGAWYFGASVVQYMDNMPSTFPSSGGGQIRVYENQGTNRFLMEITANSVAGSGKIWRCWYTSNGWGSWYEFSGTQLT